MLRVLIADDHEGVHDIVRSLLEPEFEIVGDVYDGKALIEATAKLRPNLIITDISMPILNGIDAAEELRNSGCCAVIVFLSVHTDPDFIRACYAAGGAAHVAKHTMANDLLPAIHAAVDRYPWCKSGLER